eukprot:616772-Prorocentrum_minimum.AAC.1
MAVGGCVGVQHLNTGFRHFENTKDLNLNRPADITARSVVHFSEIDGSAHATEPLEVRRNASLSEEAERKSRSWESKSTMRRSEAADWNAPSRRSRHRSGRAGVGPRVDSRGAQQAKPPPSRSHTPRDGLSLCTQRRPARFASQQILFAFGLFVPSQTRLCTFVCGNGAGEQQTDDGMMMMTPGASGAARQLVPDAECEFDSVHFSEMDGARTKTVALKVCVSAAFTSDFKS